MSLADEAARHGLSPVGRRPPLADYLRQTWERRQFIVNLARYRIQSDNQRNRLGMLWVVLQPLLNAAVYGTIFGILLAGGKPPNFVPFLVIGVFMFQFFTAAWTSGAKSITNNAALVQSLSFPRLALPLSTVTQAFLKFVPTIGVMLVIVLLFGNPPLWEWVLLVPLSLIYFVFVTGIVLITARLTAHFRDLTQIIPLLNRLIFYTTGIFFSFEERFGDHPTVLEIVKYQPIHEFLTLGRDLVLEGAHYEVDPMYWVYASLWAVVVFAIGVVFFWRAEEMYGRVI